jgi:hypothetical protein
MNQIHPIQSIRSQQNQADIPTVQQLNGRATLERSGLKALSSQSCQATFSDAAIQGWYLKFRTKFNTNPNEIHKHHIFNSGIPVVFPIFFGNKIHTTQRFHKDNALRVHPVNRPWDEGHCSSPSWNGHVQAQKSIMISWLVTYPHNITVNYLEKCLVCLP